MSIGQVLAVILYEIQNKNINHLKLNEEDKEFFYKIKNRYHELNNQPGMPEKIINTVPRAGCSADKPFLKNNTEFFIAYIILSDNNQKNLNTTPHLIQHLNDCYWCFESYNNFIRDFYYATQKITTGANI